MNQVFKASCGLVGLSLVVCSTGNAATEITLHERISVDTAIVRLGDVAKVVTADRAAGRRLAARLLMPAPAPGTHRFLRQREIQDLLAAHNEDLSQLQFAGPNQVEVVAPAAVQASIGASGRGVDREAVLLAGRANRPKAGGSGGTADQVAADVAGLLRDQYREVIIEYLTAKAGQAGAWRVSCDIAERHLVQLRSATSTPKCFGGNEPWIGRQRFLISFATADGTVQVPIHAEVALASRVVVVVRPIERGAIITASHVELQTIDYTPQASDRRTPVETVEKILGMEAKQALRSGDIVFTDQLQAPFLVKRGEVIAVVSQSGGIRVRTTARARQDGARGDLVQVESLEGKQPFDVRVTAMREATVFAGVTPVVERPESQRAATAWRQ